MDRPGKTTLKRSILAAIARGFRGRCPACGKGHLLSGYIRPVEICPACGEDLSAFRTADFAPYLVTFAIGIVFIPLTLHLSVTATGKSWMIALLAPAALAVAGVLLPRAKGAAIGLLWALGITSNQ